MIAAIYNNKKKENAFKHFPFIAFISPFPFTAFYFFVTSLKICLMLIMYLNDIVRQFE